MARAEFKNFCPAIELGLVRIDCLAPMLFSLFDTELIACLNSLKPWKRTHRTRFVPCRHILLLRIQWAKALDAARAIIESDLKDQIERLTPPKRTSFRTASL